MIIVASKAAAEKHPAWYFNVTANPDVEVEVTGRRRPMRAREATGEERSELWTYVNDHFAGYDAAQQKVARTIPVIVLEPRTA